MQPGLAALLIEEGAVSAEAMDRALARQREAGGALDTALLELGLVDEPRLTAALSRAAGLPPAPATAWEAADARARRVFPSRVAERHGLAPFALNGRELSLVASYPVDVGLLDEISFMLSLHLAAHVGPEWRVSALIHRLYGGAVNPRLAALAGADGGEELTAAPAGPAQGWAPDGLAAPPPAPAGFARDAAEPLEPLAAALAQALELEELSFTDEDAEELEPAPQPEPAAAEAAADQPAIAALDRTAPPRWTLEEARAALAAARCRDEVVLTALRYARDFFEFAAVFAVTRDAIAGHDALGVEEDARDRCRGTAIYTSDLGIFRTAIETRAPYLGPVMREAAGNEAILVGLGRRTPRTVLACPVYLRDRPVCVFYADNGEAPVSARRLGDLLLVISGVGAAFERVIQDRKRRRRGHASAPADAPADPSAPAGRRADEAWRTTEPAVADPPDFAIDVDVADVEPEAAGAPAARPELEDAMAALLASPPASPGRAVAIARLAARPGESIPALCAALPGPEGDVQGEDPSALGPVSAALSALGLSAVPALLGVLQDPDAARRRIAVILLGAVGEPAAFAQLADRALDPDPRVAAAAAAALAANRRNPAMRAVPGKLRRALLSGIVARATGAARALGALRDVEAVPLLVQVLESSDRASTEAAADALARITLQQLGTDARRWLAWWKENRGRGRAEWLFSGLTSSEREVRVLAAAELAAAAPQPVEYSPDGSAAEREGAARAWAGWWARSGRVL